MKKFGVTFLLFTMLVPACAAYELDTSVDAEIKKKYNSTKLSDEMLPQLPSNLKNSATSPTSSTATTTTKTQVPKSTPVFDIQQAISIIKPSQTQKAGPKIPRWTRFELKSDGKASSWFGLNTTISFKSTNTVNNGKITVPAGTAFKGTVVKSHASQITGNGGLLEIKITSMRYDGKDIPISAVITKVNGENIFFNRIKGARQYIEGVKNKVKSATNAYKKGRSVSAKLSANPIGQILSPLPTIGGFLAGAAGTVASPLTGLLQKGKDVNIPAGTLYEIRFIEDAYLN